MEKRSCRVRSWLGEWVDGWVGWRLGECVGCGLGGWLAGVVAEIERVIHVKSQCVFCSTSCFSTTHPAIHPVSRRAAAPRSCKSANCKSAAGQAGCGSAQHEQRMPKLSIWRFGEEPLASPNSIRGCHDLGAMSPPGAVAPPDESLGKSLRRRRFTLSLSQALSLRLHQWMTS